MGLDADRHVWEVMEMSEIKFNAFDRTAKVMIPNVVVIDSGQGTNRVRFNQRVGVEAYGDFKTMDSYCSLHNIHGIDYADLMVDCDIMQYIGLPDKNGVEIYEGFRCKFKYIEKLHEHIELVGVFNYNLDELRYEIDIEGSEHYKCLSYISNGQMYDFEVIGNIHENPELLEDK